MQADKVLLSTNIFTGIDDVIISGGIAIKENKIMSVGDIKDLIGEDTLVYNLEDRLITAGFCDSHVHLTLGCMLLNEADLSECKSQEECAKKLYDFYCSHKDRYSDNDWILGFSWYNFWWDNNEYPNKKVLDKYFPDKPVFLLNADGHGAWVNSYALELAGVDNDTINPPYGIISRDENREATGYLDEAAMSLCINSAFSICEEKEKELYEKYINVYSKSGLTSINDMQYFFGINMGNKNVFEVLNKEGKLPVRINFATGLFGEIEKFKTLKEKYNSGKIFYNGTKEFIDGLIITHTAYMNNPYTDDENADYLKHAVDLEQLKKRIEEVQGLGINIQLHATGDKAVKFALDSYKEAIGKNGFNDSRLSIEHIDILSPDDLYKFGECNIVASIQPQHMALTASYEGCPYPNAVGKERERYLWAYNSIKKNGGVLAFGTDYPTAGINPLMTIYRAVTRLFDDNSPDGGWNPEEKLTLFDAVRAYTYGGAYKTGREGELGTIEKGKLADFTIFDENIFEVTFEDIPKVKIYGTMCDGDMYISD